MIEDNVGNIWITQNEGKLNIINKRRNVFKFIESTHKRKTKLVFLEKQEF